MLGVVMQHLDSVRPNRLCHHLACRHDVFAVVGRTPGVAGVVNFAVIRLKAFGGVGVHNQHLRSLPVQQKRLRLRKILLHLLLRKGGCIFDSAAAKAKAAAGCRQVLLDHRSAVLLWNLNRLGQRLCFRWRRLFLLRLRRDGRRLHFLLLLFGLLRSRRLRKPLPQLFEGAVGHRIHCGKDSGIGCQAVP